MNFFPRRLAPRGKYLIVSVLCGWMACSFASAQDGPNWNHLSIRDSVIALLDRYVIGFNRMGILADPATERDFIHLFYNSRVQVVNDTGEGTDSPKVSAEDFVTNLAGLYPEGIHLALDRKHIGIREPKYDRNSRYVVSVRVLRTMTGLYRGKSFENVRKMDFRITFILRENQPEGFAIYGTDIPYQGDHLLDAGISPSVTALRNSTIRGDGRLLPAGGTGFSAGLRYLFDFSEHFGVGTGLQVSRYEGSVMLDHFDPLGGFDPGMEDIRFVNRLYFAELPVFLTGRMPLARNLSLRAEAGALAGYRLFEETGSSAVSTSTGSTLTNVVSDPGWMTSLNRMNFSVSCRLSVVFRASSRLGVYLGAGWVQGLTSVDNNTRADFVYSKYLGQYNPLWGAPGRTVSRAFDLRGGILVRLNRQNRKI